MSLEFDAALRLGAFDYDVAFEASGELVVLFGRSGAGKSVTLQIAAGLLRPTRGCIVIDGRTVVDTSAGTFVRPQDRSVGYVVQDLALFTHLSVAENIAFGMPNGRDRRGRVHELLALLGLEGFERRGPRTLSGGQQQRVALARALARDASLLLLDEPFSALDESLREEMRHELLRLRAELGLTVVVVTHDLREAHLLADRMAVMDAGRILQFDTRETVFRRPASRRVAELTGIANIVRGRVARAAGNGVVVEVAGIELTSATPGTWEPGQAVDLAIRQERVNLRRGAPPGLTNVFRCEVAQELAYGSTHVLRLTATDVGPPVSVELGARPYDVLAVASQREWLVELPAEHIHVMAAG